jgi:CRISPR/Cas system-associated exonuclease Cas4 (RecB family)
LSALFDRSVPFAQTANTDICKNCDFKEICVRG